MRLFRFVSLGLLVALNACGSTEGGEFQGSDQGLPLETLPAKYAAAACAASSRCLGDLYAVFLPGEDCVENLEAQLSEELPALQDAVDDERVIYDGSKMQACIDEVAARGCAELLDRESAACMAALDGAVAEGDSCSLDSECEGEGYCSHQESCPGVCAKLERAGGECRGDSNCASGLVCGEKSRCVAPSVDGELCQQGEPNCAPGYACLGEDSEKKTPGTCVALQSAFSAKLGQACDFASQLCEAGRSCEVQAVIPALVTECVAEVAAGAACKVAIPDECPDSQYCRVAPLSLEGTCEPKPEAGKPCGVASFNREGTPSICAAYARCDDGVCRDLANLGENCNADATCYSGRCLGKACVASNGCE